MEQTWLTSRPIRQTSTDVLHMSASDEQTQYQQDVFQSVQKAVVPICAVLGIIYISTFIQQARWPALVIGLVMCIIAIYSAASLYLAHRQNFTIVLRIWLALATCTCCTFGLFQSSEFTNIAALGSTIVIVLAIFLEPVRNSYQWALANVASYVLIVILRNVTQFPEFDLGALRLLVINGTPVAILFIVTEMGRVTTQHFKHNLIQSEARRKQLETQEQQLISYTVKAEDARAKAERSDRVKSAFLASMSHELRTPLNAVINFTCFVIDGDIGPINDRQADLLNDVVSSAKHLLSLINDVLDMSKIEAGSLILFVEENIDLYPLTNSVVSMARSLLVNKEVQLNISLPADLPHIRCDRQRVLQILLNIMSNACKFTEQGDINFAARVVGENIIFSIKDSGPGIDASDQGIVFEAFKQTQTGLQHGGGTGLGMAISKNLTAAHGGRLWFESEPGAGATFYVSLPIQSETLATTLP